MQKLKKGVYWNGKEVRYPIKKDLDKPFHLGNIDWKNLLGLRNLSMFFITLLLVITLLVGSWAYQHDTEACFNLIEHPQLWCSNWMKNQTAVECTQEQQQMGLCVKIEDIEINWSLIG